MRAIRDLPDIRTHSNELSNHDNFPHINTTSPDVTDIGASRIDPIKATESLLSKATLHPETSAQHRNARVLPKT
ncbi:hypothetical protein E2P81_ATG10071 [Venturia nashicola]|uniref:Uncharacterized protein n=1 Tax=Venturia nashicola TaxID=86259 RepID=A0A4Z1NR03_9PEZI|nr:hypothetical protein E6O75_ATG10289 [Venturia nashicola]TLD18249.1 hypothetical protein E2P81_ATG10071 [Venturia nashicola]